MYLWSEVGAVGGPKEDNLRSRDDTWETHQAGLKGAELVLYDGIHRNESDHFDQIIFN